MIRRMHVDEASLRPTRETVRAMLPHMPERPQRGTLAERFPRKTRGSGQHLHTITGAPLTAGSGSSTRLSFMSSPSQVWRGSFMMNLPFPAVMV